MTFRSRLLVSVVATTLLGACGDDSATGGTTTSSASSTGSGTSSSSSSSSSSSGSGGGGGAGMQTFTIPFEAYVGTTPFDCTATYPMVGSPATSIAISDFRLYVHDVRLLDMQGKEVPLTLDQDGVWQYQDVALLDFENKTGACANGTTETNKTLRGKAPAGDYMGVAFKIGVPASLNHLDAATAPSPLSLSALFWVWTDGYKFARIDTKPTAMGGMPFFVHLGAGGCTGDPAMMQPVTCTNPNVPDVVLDHFHFTQGMVGVFDFGALTAGSNLAADQGGAPGCMSEKTDLDCGPIFQRLGLDLATGMPSGTQSFVRVQ
jgi:uncharacterized repeat protein (TIGR04052 family)